MKITQEFLSQFELVVWVNSSTGLDINDGLTSDTPIQTIAGIDGIINTQSNGVKNKCIILMSGTLFSGASTLGFFPISSYNTGATTIVGQGETYAELPTLVATNYNLIINTGTGLLKLIHLKLESNGTAASSEYDRYAMLATQNSASKTIEYHNCYLKPRGVGFIASGYHKFYNCVIDYSGHAFTVELFYKYNYAITVTFVNCFFLGTCTARDLADYVGSSTSTYCMRTTSSIPQHTMSTGCILATTATLAEDKQISGVLTWINAGNPTMYNPDGTRSNIGLYGGTYAIGVWNWEIIATVERDPYCQTPIYTSAYAANVLATPPYSEAYAASKAFNGVFGSAGLGYVPKQTYILFFIGWNFTVPQSIDYITWYYDYSATVLPTKFVVEGSNDLTTWTNLATFSSGSWLTLTKYKFPIPESEYQAYRMRVTAYKNESASVHYFGELELCYSGSAAPEGSLNFNLTMPVAII